ITTTASSETPSALAQTYLTARNYPNPFNPVTTIEFSIPSAGQVGLAVYDITGREVASLVNGNLSAGIHAVDWNGVSAPTGIYFYRLSYGTQQITQRMLLVK
ncbi:T9SS type A sorting domain-containing protein, partial [bacterium]|nr:T9SS type A sorting domain-containing protein [bacterium]